MSPLLLLAALGLLAPAANAQPQASREGISTVKALAVTPLSNEAQAHSWALKPEEWARYQQLMQGPLGIYSPHLDPLSALGIEAQSDAERQHYAQLQVQAESGRIEKLLAYQRAYDAAWQQQFPDLLPVNLPDIAPQPGSAQRLRRADRPALFVKANCPLCVQRVKRLQAQATAFDLYLVDSDQDDFKVRQWARLAGIDPIKVHDRVITLNHDDGLWLSLSVPGPLPALVRQVSGQWQRQ